MKRKLLATLITGLLLLTFIIQPVLADIPDDAVEFNGHSYKAFTQDKTWKAANKACKKLGGHLVTITSAEEQSFVYKQAKKYKGNQFWIGLTDADQEGEWKWVTGEPVTYTNWGKGNPNDDQEAGGQDYGVLYTTKEDWGDGASGVKPGQWDDDNGKSNPFYYICEWDEVKDQQIKSIKLNKKSVSIKKKETYQLKIKKTDPAAAISQKFKWTTSDKKVAKVDKNGKVKAVGKGECTITCEATDGSGVKAEVKVKVK